MFIKKITPNNAFLLDLKYCIISLHIQLTIFK